MEMMSSATTLASISTPISSISRRPVSRSITINAPILRLANVTQARNYIRIIATHPGTQFGVWTKNLAIWNEALELEVTKFETADSMIDLSCTQKS